MAVTKNLKKVSLRFYVENGVNTDGTKTYKARSYSRINPEVTLDNAKTFLKDIASLQTGTVPETMDDETKSPYEIVSTDGLIGEVE